MGMGIKCDLCGIPIGATEGCNAFRMWNGVRSVEIEQKGLDGIAFDGHFFICDDCANKAYELLVKIKVVSE